MSMRDYEDLKDIEIPREQEMMMDIMRKALEECRELHCASCPDRPKKYMRMIECIALKYSRLLYEAGLAYTEEDVRNAYNDGYACGMKQRSKAAARGVRICLQGGRMSFARKLRRKTQNKRKTRCCGQQMTHKDGGYVCEKCGKVKHD